MLKFIEKVNYTAFYRYAPGNKLWPTVEKICRAISFPVPLFMPTPFLPPQDHIQRLRDSDHIQGPPIAQNATDHLQITPSHITSPKFLTRNSFKLPPNNIWARDLLSDRPKNISFLLVLVLMIPV